MEAIWEAQCATGEERQLFPTWEEKNECYQRCGAGFRLSALQPVQTQQPGKYTQQLSGLCKIWWLTAEENEIKHSPLAPQCGKTSQRN